ncbi:hypothetical protein JCM17846_10210 [Iodidimonas nitroreducens]|uniref:DUF948 domain-containing protein n=1 Tax=Iodidimonas nitroreducens TaxID=1236968 RepID=A0A5A7N8F2_9PROT|nr:hypothetical protein [Iodidimonas nitroreducens]GER03339.1 hypothetical protein JCM17846_10210 [Iodidimonas nitroreducens]
MNGMLINILVIVALLASALYSIRLNKKISEMRTALRDMESLFKDFGAQVDRSQSLLADMKAAGDHIATVLDEGVFEARKSIAVLTSPLIGRISTGPRPPLFPPRPKRLMPPRLRRKLQPLHQRNHPAINRVSKRFYGHWLKPESNP